ncbi:phage head closure protein [Martelella alba]|uniref:phage head closure protein n=1 Tax=Martelella alba TaxID=2590451 RepID=UPI001F3FB863|nr:phage head closure protein [Martelella alba]
MILPMDSGAFSERLNLLRPVDTADGQGGVTRDFESFGKAWARVEPQSVAYDEEANGGVRRITHRIWLRHRDDLVAEMRFAKGGRQFRLVTSYDPDETGRYLVCRCEEISS